MTHGEVARAGPFVLQHGCDAGDAGCFGPIGNYWTLFGSEVGMLGLHLAAALVLATLLAALASHRARARPAHVRALLAAATLLATALLAFLALAALAPVHVQY